MCHNQDCFNLEHLRCLPVKEHIQATRTVVDLRTSLERAEVQIAELEARLGTGKAA
jgi:hypothetical protein